MGQKVILTCDLHTDNTEAVDTVRFAVGGITYELELCEKHLKEFNDKLTPFTNAARSAAGGGRRRAAPARARSGSARPTTRRRRRPAATDLSAVREWARDNGYAISTRGRIPGAILEAYEAAANG